MPFLWVAPLILSAHQEVERLLDQIRAVTSNPAIERATDQISVFVRGNMATIPSSRWDAFGLTATQERFVSALFARPGQTISRSAMLDALYFDKPAEPDPKVFDVMLMHIRRKLAGSSYSIQTIWGIGFRGLTEDHTEGN